MKTARALGLVLVGVMQLGAGNRWSQSQGSGSGQARATQDNALGVWAKSCWHISCKTALGHMAFLKDAKSGGCWFVRDQNRGRYRRGPKPRHRARRGSTIGVRLAQQLKKTLTGSSPC